MSMRWWPGASVVLVSGMAAFGSLQTESVRAQQSEQTFGSWRVSCDAERFCDARSLALGDGAAGAFSLARHAEEIWWELSFTPNELADEWSPFIFSLDGQETRFDGRSEIGAYGMPNRFYLLGAKAQSVLDRIVLAERLAVDFSGRDGEVAPARFSLDGLSAAIMQIDTLQGRIGAERMAEAPPFGLVPSGMEQGEAPRVPVALMERRRAEPDCAALEDLPNGRDFIVGQVGSGAQKTGFYAIPCNGGAYNFSSAIYTGAEGFFMRHVFAEFWPSTGWTGVNELFSAGFDEAEQTLSSFYRSRGIGDCGSSALYRWADGAFRLEEFRAKEECDGMDGEFPVVYELAPPQPDPASRNRAPQARPAQ